MRLSSQYIDTIKKYYIEIFQDGDVYLFGSRVDDKKRGGDIDLYLTPTDHSDLFRKKIKFLASLKLKLGDQKIDVVFNSDPERLIEKEARKWGIKL